MSGEDSIKSRIDLDALLPAREGVVPPLPSGATDDASWDEHADVIVQRLRGGPKLGSSADQELLSALCAAPSLAPEPGEPSSSRNAGVTTMSDSDHPKSNSSEAPVSIGARAAASRQPRPSLKELAERVSKTPGPSSVAPSSGRISAVSTPLPGATTMPSATSTPLPATRTPLPVPAAATPLPIPAPESKSAPISTPPRSETAPAPTKVEEPKPSEAAKKKELAPVIPIEAARAPLPEKTSGGYGGLVVAGLGIAAAAGLFIFLRASNVNKSADNAANKPVETVVAPPPATEQPEEHAAVETSTAKAAPAPVPTETASADDGTDINKLADASSSAAPTPGGLGALPPASAVAANEPKKDPAKPFVPNPDGTLDDAMRDAAGNPINNKKPEPASQEATGPKNVPDTPPQGSISAYVGSVMGRAKACVAGADDNSSASVTFGSGGQVQKVTVGGWAAGKSAASCIEAALKGGKVEPFSKATYGFTVTIRP